MKNHEIVKLLESSNSRKFKEEVLLGQMKLQNKIFFEGLSLACNKLLTFGVKKIPESNSNGNGLSWEIFKTLAQKLLNRDLTGHAARDEIINNMEKATEDEWNFFYRRILIKDMRCGLSEKTINNVAKANKYYDFLIPVFACQLSQDCELHKKKLIGKKILQIKLDGVRAISILYPNGNVDIFSRNGKQLINFNSIENELKKIFESNSIKSAIVLDGEIVSKNFQELMKQIHRKNSLQDHDAKLYIFDFLSFENFSKGKERIPQDKRIQNLKKWYEENLKGNSRIKILDDIHVDLDSTEGNKEFKKFNNDAVVNGYEGIMIKDPGSFYECKRSTNWLKSKPIIEVSLKVKSYEEGSGKNKGKLGAIIAEGNDNGKFFRLNIGSGFTDKQRSEFWLNRQSLIGQIIEIRADSISKSQDGDFWSLRFPRFKCFRGFEINEKI
tara:strand:+ start:331 stop:1650 length:1320 start_codon:yes stop_codon:yes gene_type:complete